MVFRMIKILEIQFLNSDGKLWNIYLDPLNNLYLYFLFYVF